MKEFIKLEGGSVFSREDIVAIEYDDESEQWFVILDDRPEYFFLAEEDYEELYKIL